MPLGLVIVQGQGGVSGDQGCGKQIFQKAALARIAYLRLPPHLVFITFPQAGPMPVWDGMQMQTGDVMFHGSGRHLHQSTLGLSGWSVIAADPQRLADFYKVLTGEPLVILATASVLQPARPHAAWLRRVHAQVCCLAETKPRMLGHPKVVRAIEQALLQTLADSLSAATKRQDAEPRSGCAAMIIKLEEVLDAHAPQLLRMPDLCRLIGASDRSLRLCCDTFLGVTPLRYLQLRRLKRVRQVLRDADPSADIVEVAAYHGFNRPTHFAKFYRATFGEPPSATLQRPLDPEAPLQNVAGGNEKTRTNAYCHAECAVKIDQDRPQVGRHDHI